MAVDGILITPTATTPRKSMPNILPFSITPDATNHLFSPPRFPHTFSDSLMQENIENAETIITKWDPSNTPTLEKFTSLFYENRNEANEFTKSVGELRRAMHFLVAQRSDSNNLVLANKLIKIAMLRLQKEFYYILSINRDCLDPESVSNRSSSHLSRRLSLSNSDDEIQDHDYVQTSKVERAMADLKVIAESMISSGYSRECAKIYRITRKSIMDEELHRLGIGSYTQSQIKNMDQRVLENQLEKWIDRAKVVGRTLFRGERLLCDHVFDVSETIKQTCFAHTTMEGAMNLLKFPELVAKSKQSLPDKILILMNLYEAVSGLWPEIELIFSYECLSPVKLQALSSMHKLRDSAETNISEFVSSLKKNSSKMLIIGGGVHPLTFQVMNYVSLLAENSCVLSDILTSDESETGAQSPFPESYFNNCPTSSVSSRIAWIILVLLCKLDNKAELYKDISLSYLFLANNIQFVVERVSATAAKLLLGEEWLSKLEKKVKLYAANYESVAWAKVLSFLPAENNEESPPVNEVKERFRGFNSAFEAANRKQRTWVVPDRKLRDEIKESIARKVVPAYRGFYERYSGVLSGEMLVRFSPDNLGNHLSDLFHTTADLVVSGDYLSSSSSSYSSHSRLSRCL